VRLYEGHAGIVIHAAYRYLVNPRSRENIVTSGGGTVLAGKRRYLGSQAKQSEDDVLFPT